MPLDFDVANRQTLYMAAAAEQSTEPNVASGQWGVGFMGVIAWIILGAIGGFIGSKIVNSEGQGVLLNIVLGIVGAVVGGVIANAFGFQGVTGFNIYSILISILGSVVVLWVYHQVTGRRRL